MAGPRRCPWPGIDPLYLRYHDEEWGVPVRDDVELFQHLLLDGAQAGLSWITILRKRDAYRRAFDGLDPVAMAAYDEARIQRLLADPGIVRNRLKVKAFVTNARAFLEVQARESFAGLLWSFVGGEPRQNAWRTGAEVPAETPQSRAMSRELKRRGMVFVGPTICYAFMQAVGMVNDHLVECFRHADLGGSPSALEGQETGREG
jgi:DNA-3-methyladenine glycosylase I